MFQKGLKLDLSKTAPYLQEHEIKSLQPFVNEAHKMLHDGTGAGNDFLGWVDLPINYDKAEFERIKKAAEKIRSNSPAALLVKVIAKIFEVYIFKSFII